MDQKERREIDDFDFVFDTRKKKNNYGFMQLKDSNGNIKYIHCQNFTNVSDLSLYLDCYIDSQNFLNDENVKTKKPELIIIVNKRMVNSLSLKINMTCESNKIHLSCKGKLLFENIVNLYKFNLDKNMKRRHKLFCEQFVSQSKRLANELAKYVLLNEPIDILSMRKNDSVSLIKTFYKMLLVHVIDEENNHFKESFLTLGKQCIPKSSKEIDFKKFRKDFYDSLGEFCHKYENKTVEEIVAIFCSDFSQEGIIKAQELQKNLVSLSIKKYENPDKRITIFLRGKKNILKEISKQEIIQNIAKELVLSVILQKSFDISLVVPGQKAQENYTKIMRESVFECSSLKLKETFLNPRLNKSKLVKNLRNCFFDYLRKFHNISKNKEINELELISVHEALKNFKKKKKFKDFLMNKKLRFKNFTEETENVSCLFPSTNIDSVNIERKILAFLNLITFAVIEGDDNVTLTEIESIMLNKKDVISISDCVNEFIKKWQHWDTTIFQDFDSIFEKSQFSTEICSTCEWISVLSLTTINKDKILRSTKCFRRELVSFYSPRTLIKSKSCSKDKKYFTEDEIIENEKYVIITGESGSGKTVLFDYALNLLKKLNKYPSHLLLKISLGECQKYLRCISNLKEEKSAVEFLAECFGGSDCASRNILKYFLRQSNLIIFFDGFEELLSECRQKIKDLLIFLKISNVKLLWISTTPHYAEELEYALDVASFKIKDLSESEQINLVAYILRISHEDSSFVYDFNQKSKQLIQIFNNSFKRGERNLLGIPLYTCMIAIAFKDEIIYGLPITFDGMNLFQIYECYIKRKICAFLTEKSTDEGTIYELSNHYHNLLQIFSLRYGRVIRSRDTAVLITDIAKEKQNYRDLFHIGLVRIIIEIGFQFVHKSFAEYFLAMYLASNRETYDENTIEVITNIIVKSKSDIMLQTFDSFFVVKLRKCRVQNSTRAEVGNCIFNWKILIQLIVQLEAKNRVYYHYLHLISDARRECFDVFIELISREKNVPQIVSAVILNKMLSVETELLKRYVRSYSDFIYKISVGPLHLVQKECVFNRFLVRISDIKLSEFVHLLCIRIENFKILCKNMFENGVSFGQLSIELRSKSTNQFRIIYFGFDSCFYYEIIRLYFEKVFKTDIHLPCNPIKKEHFKKDYQDYANDFLKTLNKYDKVCKFSGNETILEMVQRIIDYIFNLRKLLNSLKYFRKRNNLKEKGIKVSKIINEYKNKFINRKNNGKRLRNVNKYFKRTSNHLKLAPITNAKKRIRKNLKKLSININYYKENLYSNYEDAKVNHFEKLEKSILKKKLDKLSRNIYDFKNETHVRKESKAMKVKNLKNRKKQGRDIKELEEIAFSNWEYDEINEMKVDIRESEDIVFSIWENDEVSERTMNINEVEEFLFSNCEDDDEVSDLTETISELDQSEHSNCDVKLNDDIHD